MADSGAGSLPSSWMRRSSLIPLCLVLWQMVFSHAAMAHGQEKRAGGHYLAVSICRDQAMAFSAVSRLKEQGSRAFYRENGQGGAIQYTVVSGPYPTEAGANADGEKLRENGLADSVRIVASSAKRIVAQVERRSSSIAPTSAHKMGNPPVRARALTTKNKTGPTRSIQPAMIASPADKPAGIVESLTGEKTGGTTTGSVSPPEVGAPPTIPEPASAASIAPSQETPPWPYFDEAMQDFRKGRYAKARPVFRAIAARHEIASLWRELAERRLADCNYFLKESNSNEVLSEIVYQYRNLLFKYPDVRNGNDLAYFRMGQLYRAMGLYADAAEAYRNLLTKYPGSSLAEEGLYQMGEVLRLDEKYAEAADTLQAFYTTYPASALSRPAIFALADTCYRMGRSRDADVWYGNALQRWPDLYGLPDDIFLNTGYHFFHTGKYREAFQVFSYFYGLYPQSRYAPLAARAMGRSLVGTGRVASAVRLLSVVLGKERDRKEAIKTRLLLAELGGSHPGAVTSICFRDVEHYREPLLSCNRMISELEGDVLTEEVLYRRGKILKAGNRFREAFDNYAVLLRLYPGSPHRIACQREMEANRNILVGDYYVKGHYLDIADLYFTESGFRYHRDWDVLFRIADSLKQLGLYREAATVFQDVKNTQEYGDPDKLDLAIAETEMKSGRIREGRSRLNVLLAQKRTDTVTAKKAHRMLADSYFLEMNYEAAIASYESAMPVDRGEMGAALSLYRYADALKRQGRDGPALRYYQESLDAANMDASPPSVSLKGELLLNLGEMYLGAGQYEKAVPLLMQALAAMPKGTDQCWALFRLTGGHINLNNPDLAETFSGRIRENTEDPFWEKMADYCLNDGIWFATYADFLT
ncbi:MAG: tetratricopeptide repeat protein [Syntrophales bacterium]|nr:tetratricopeptide repeat protein [Syntrophales bacterium]